MQLPEWVVFIFFLVALFALIGLAELLRRLMRWSPEVTRKSVHVITGLLVATTPFLLESMWPMLVLAGLFMVVNYLGIRYGAFKSMHATERPTYGTVFYPVAFFVLVLLLWRNHTLILVTSVLILALADAVAAIVGESVDRPIMFFLAKEKKSLQGSFAMLVSSFVIVFGCLYFFRDAFSVPLTTASVIWVAGVVAIFATVCEAVSVNGSDNLTVPLGSALIMYYMLNHQTADNVIFTLGMGLALMVALLSYRVRFLDASGAAATFVLGTIVFGIGRWTFSAPILTFFLLSSVLSKLGRRRKSQIIGVFEKSSCRDLWQVLANGGVAGFLLLLWYFHPNDVWYVLFLASVAAVMADTWGTEIGILSEAVPRSIIHFKKVPIGSSGAVTLLGTAGAGLGSLILVSVGWLFGPHSSPKTVGMGEFFIILVAGLLASVVDSILGATVQAQYQCPTCFKLTEKVNHCGSVRTQLQRGYRWINNDVVNFLCAVSGVLLAGIGMVFIKR